MLIPRERTYRYLSRQPFPTGPRMVTDQKGVALIMTFIFMASLTIIAGAYLFMVSYGTKNVTIQTNNAKTVYLADAGLNKAVWYLTHTAPDSSTDGSWRTTAYPAAAGPNPTDPQQESLGDGTYAIWVEDSGSDVMVTSRGSVGSLTRTVREMITLSSSAPEAFNYLQHAGGDIDFNLSAGTITGNLSAIGTVDNESGMTITGTITESSTVVTPAVDMASYAAIATTTVSGNKTFSAGTYSGIWYVSGNVTIADNVTFNGTIVTAKTITLTNTDNFVSNPASNYPALVANKSISGSRMGTSTINGVVYATNDITLNRGTGNAVTGVIIAGGDIDMTRGAGWNLTYNASIASNPPPYITDSASSVSATGDAWKEI